MKEVDLQDLLFILVNDALNIGDLLDRVEDVTVSKVIWPRLARLAII